MTERRYPSRVVVDGLDLMLRPIGRGDLDAMLAFAAALPPHDLVFLDRDLTSRAEISLMIEQAEAGSARVMLAFSKNAIAGYAALERSRTSWMRHVADVRLMVGPAFRRRGLGRRLMREVFEIARDEGTEKLVAQMTIDQEDAVRVFETFSFRREALLADHVRDRDGTKHHLVVMGLDVREWEAALAEVSSRPMDAA